MRRGRGRNKRKEKFGEVERSTRKEKEGEIYSRVSSSKTRKSSDLKVAGARGEEVKRKCEVETSLSYLISLLWNFKRVLKILKNI